MSIATSRSVLLASALFVLVCGTSVRAAPDCRVAERYITLARAQLAASQIAEAESLLQQSIDECPSYEAYQSLGELQAKSSRRADQVHARDAFWNADKLAPTDEAHARTRYHYASLLTRNGDPQNAYQLIREAQHLDPKNPDIVQLSSQIERQVRNPTQEHIMRGGASLYKPLETPVAGDK